MRRILPVAAVLVLCVAAAAVLAPRRLGEALFARGVAAGVNRDVGASLPDGLHVALCGTGSPMADPTRAGPCTAVIAGQRLFIVDIGSGAARKLGPMGLNIGTVDGLFLTHFHSDHIDGLGELMTLRWATGNRARPLPVYGPTGVDRVTAGFNAAYALDQTYRIAHHGAAVVPPAGRGVVPRSFAADGPVVVFDAGGVRVTAFPVTHAPVTPAVGYRFDYKERSVVVSGDTAPDRRIAVAAKGADLLVHEALNADMVRLLGRRLAAAGRSKPAKVMSDILSYHASPEDAATTAAQAGAGMLVLTHIVPPLPTRLLDSYFLGDAADRFGGPIVVGRDGMLFSLPSGSREIGRRDLE
jgi:ribonuclease Z